MSGFARWCCTVLGGVLIGAGLVLHGQVALARFLRDEVEETFFLWRAIGHATFTFQGGETRLALAMSEVPPEALAASDGAAWGLLLLGLAVATLAPMLAGSDRKAPPKRAKRA